MRITRRRLLETGLKAGALAVIGDIFGNRFLARALAAQPDYYLDGIKSIKSPLFSNPLMILTSDPVKISLKDPKFKLTDAVLLDDGGNKTALKIQKTDNGFEAAASGGLKPGVYDLDIMVDDGKSSQRELQPRAVAVFSQFKKDFDFVFVSDIHFGAHADDHVIQISETQLYKSRHKALAAVNDYNPEFIILGGDLALYPKNYAWGFPENYLFSTYYFKRPVHILPGNHDVYHMVVEELGGKHVYGWDYWNKYYGALYHSFNYGTVHGACLNTSDWPDELLNWGSRETTITGSLLSVGISDEQFAWLRNDMEDQAPKSSETVVFAHIPLTQYISGTMTGIPRKRLPGPDKAEMIALLEKAGVKRTFNGHLHYHVVNQLSDQITENVISNVGGTEMEYSVSSFANIHVKDGGIVGYDNIDIKS